MATSLNASLAYRYNGANNWGADLFVSIHCNAANTKAYGCETYYCTGSTQGKALADCIQPHLVAETSRYNRGVKSGNFAVIRHTNMPAVLVETAFIDNYDDNSFLASESGKKACATAIYKGICDYLGIGYKTEESEVLTMTQYEELLKENNRQNEVINALGADVATVANETAKLKESAVVYNYIDENMPEYARPTIQKLVEKGLLKGNENGELGLTNDLLQNAGDKRPRRGVWGVKYVILRKKIGLVMTTLTDHTYYFFAQKHILQLVEKITYLCGFSRS